MTKHIKLKMLRAKHGLNQTQMAEIAGLHYSSYCKKENGQKEFTLTEVKKILKHFNEKFEDIFLD